MLTEQDHHPPQHPASHRPAPGPMAPAHGAVVKIPQPEESRSRLPRQARPGPACASRPEGHPRPMPDHGRDDPGGIRARPPTPSPTAGHASRAASSSSAPPYVPATTYGSKSKTRATPGPAITPGMAGPTDSTSSRPSPETAAGASTATPPAAVSPGPGSAGPAAERHRPPPPGVAREPEREAVRADASRVRPKYRGRGREPRQPAHRVPPAACRRVRKVIDHRSLVTGAMLCCHCVRAGPDRT
jgi:hypothetical protein